MSDLTQRAIKAAFLQLLDAHPLAKITVKDVVEACGLHRNSFYYHYRDLPDLLEKIVADDIARLTEQYTDVDSFEECLRIAVEFTLAHRKAVNHIFHSVNRDIFERYLWQVCEYVVAQYLQKSFTVYDIAESDRPIIVHFYKCEIFGQVMGWLDAGMESDILSVNARLCALRKGMLEELLRRSAASKNG